MRKRELFRAEALEANRSSRKIHSNKNDPLLLASTEVYGVQGRERSSESIELHMERKQLLQKQIEKIRMSICKISTTLKIK